MNDAFKRDINYLRISVTDKCNLRCIYCMPEEGVELIDYEEILRLEEIVKIVRAGVAAGIRKVRFTGGEPLVRKGITDLIAMVSDIPEIDDVALTTNGILLADMAEDLKKAGLKRVNISMDTLEPEKFRYITRGGDLRKVWLGIETAFDAGFDPVKINTVAIRGFNDGEIENFLALTEKMALHVRFIELMPIGAGGMTAGGGYISTDELKELISRKYELIPEKGVAGSGPARYYRIPGAPGTVGFISPISNHFCSECNRLRLTSEGRLRLCLQSPKEIDLKTPLRSGASEEEIARIIRTAVGSKPEKHELVQKGWAGNKRIMNQIGG